MSNYEDKYEEKVAKAIAAWRSENPFKISVALWQLMQLPRAEMVAELFLWVQDLTAGKDITALLASTTLPLPQSPRSLIDAALTGNLEIALAISAGSPGKLVGSMIALIAALQEAGERV